MTEKKRRRKPDLSPINCLGHYVAGGFKFVAHQSFSSGKKHISPADFDDIIWTWPKKIPAPVEEAFETGEKAHLPWARLSLKTRAKKLSPLKQIFKSRERELSQIISRETGKPLWESEGEVRALIGKIHFVLGEGLNRIKERKVPKAKGRVRFKSRGLLVVIGPFNFPMHLPFGQILPALASGNTVLFKPSEKTPASGQKLAECFHQLGLPPGVFQMIQGGPQVSKKLCSHKKGKGLLFTGSFETGQKIKESLIKDYSKILALEMGGYNSALIWDDKNYELALKESLKGCFLTAGQRCSSTSQIILKPKIASSFIKDFVRRARDISIDHWLNQPFMGPLIDSAAVQRFVSFQNEVKKEGGKILLEGKKLKGKKGYYVSPGIYKMKFNKKSRLGTKETFTPQVIIYESPGLDEALEIISHSGYGLSLSLFSEDKATQEEVSLRAPVGLINYNLSSVGASALLPFGGLGKSGNDRPAGALAMDFCVSPLAEKAKDDKTLF